MESSIIFSVDDLTLRLPLSAVKEVLLAAEIVKAPARAAELNGLNGLIGWINVRGDLISVYDVRGQVGLKSREEEPTDVIVLFSNGEETVAVLANDVIGINDADGAFGSDGSDGSYGSDETMQGHSQNQPLDGDTLRVEKETETILSVKLSSFPSASLVSAVN